MNEKLKYDLRGWNNAYGEIKEAVTTLNFYRITYNNKIPKKELEANLVSLESWAIYAYTTKRLFHVTAIIEANDEAYADIIFNEGRCLVRFLDEYGRTFMTYIFEGDLKPGQLFLDTLKYWVYPSDKKTFMILSDHIEFCEYKFTPEGKLTVTREKKEAGGGWLQTVEEAAHPIDVSKNWEPYPKLGHYEGIVKMERWQEGDFLKNPPGPDIFRIASFN
jgi:hypothetical protein